MFSPLSRSIAVFMSLATQCDWPDLFKIECLIRWNTSPDQQHTRDPVQSKANHLAPLTKRPISQVQADFINEHNDWLPHPFDTNSNSLGPNTLWLAPVLRFFPRQSVIGWVPWLLVAKMENRLDYSGLHGWRVQHTSRDIDINRVTKFGREYLRSLYPGSDLCWYLN